MTNPPVVAVTASSIKEIAREMPTVPSSNPPAAASTTFARVRFERMSISPPAMIWESVLTVPPISVTLSATATVMFAFASLCVAPRELDAELEPTSFNAVELIVTSEVASSFTPLAMFTFESISERAYDRANNSFAEFDLGLLAACVATVILRPAISVSALRLICAFASDVETEKKINPVPITSSFRIVSPPSSVISMSAPLSWVSKNESLKLSAVIVMSRPRTVASFKLIVAEVSTRRTK